MHSQYAPYSAYVQHKDRILSAFSHHMHLTGFSQDSARIYTGYTVLSLFSAFSHLIHTDSFSVCSLCTSFDSAMRALRTQCKYAESYTIHCILTCYTQCMLSIHTAYRYSIVTYLHTAHTQLPHSYHIATTYLVHSMHTPYTHPLHRPMSYLCPSCMYPVCSDAICVRPNATILPIRTNRRTFVAHTP